MSETAKADVEICNKLGLHTRPSRQLAAIAKSYDAAVTVRNKERAAAADSQLDLLMLLADKGSTIEVAAVGPDAEAVVQAIVELVESRFGEDE